MSRHGLSGAAACEKYLRERFGSAHAHDAHCPGGIIGAQNCPGAEVVDSRNVKIPVYAQRQPSFIGDDPADLEEYVRDEDGTRTTYRCPMKGHEWTNER